MTHQQEHRKWAREIELASKREKPWRDEAKDIIRKYRGEEAKRNTFNILLSNTEILRGALYSDVPRPDVRRRFKDPDRVGKIVSEVTSRALQVALDGDRFDSVMRASVLDTLLPGRGVCRVRYVPSLSAVGVTPETHEGPMEQPEEPTHEAHEGYTEELEYEQAIVEHVDWEDFARGYGRCWDEVQWVGFRCRLSKEDVEERFGPEVAEALKYEQDEDEQNKDRNQADKPEDQAVQKTTELWEIWDKEEKRVFFHAQGYKEGLIYPIGNEAGEPPLEFEGFFPCPQPLMLIEDSSSLLPIPQYRVYKMQAEELERVSGRINRLLDECKVRGIYDARLGELEHVLKSSEQSLIPVQAAATMASIGGLDKAISYMPIEQIIKVLERLYEAREQIKATIYEITGLSDIVRGASEKSETATAQQIKSQYVSLRLQRMRGHVQRYGRDIVRMLAEVISEKFSPETLARMTGVNLPTEQQKQQAMLMQQMAQMQGMQQPPNPMLQQPSWEEIVQIMRDDMARNFRVDVETDSMVASTIESDMQALGQVLQGITQFWAGAFPAVQAGALPVDAVKAITLAIARRARLGTEVEDAMESMQQPPPPQPPPPNPLDQAKLEVEKEKIGAEKMRAESDKQAMAMDAEFKQREHAYRMEELRAKTEAQLMTAMIPSGAQQGAGYA